VKKAKKDKSDPNAPAPPTPEDLASQKVQNAPLGLADQATDQKKPKPKGDKTRYADRPKQPDETPAPYLGKPAPAGTQPPASGTGQPAPATAPPSGTPPAAQQP
jgi:hypothetical protein